MAEVSHSEKKDKLTLVTGLPLSLQYFKDLLFRLPKSRKKGNKERQCFGSGSELEGFPNQYWEDGSRSRFVKKTVLNYESPYIIFKLQQSVSQFEDNSSNLARLALTKVLSLQVLILFNDSEVVQFFV